MIYSRRITIGLSVLGALLSAGCDDRAPTHAQSGCASSACADSIFQLSSKELEALNRQGMKGNLAAERKLYFYYSSHVDEKKLAYWEDRLVERDGDGGALGMRAEKALRDARDLNDADPQKMVLLRQAQSFDARSRRVAPPRDSRVMVNGKWLMVDFVAAADEFTRNIQAELERVTVKQSKRG